MLTPKRRIEKNTNEPKNNSPKIFKGRKLNKNKIGKKVYLIGGIPCSGKTTLMRKIKKELEINNFYENGCLKGYKNAITEDYVFGLYNDELFDGTDQLSMSVQPLAVDFIYNKQFKRLFIEGDRLFKKTFIEKIKKITELNIYILKAPSKVIKDRHIQREDNQDERWLNAKQTTVDNVVNKYECHILPNETTLDMMNIYQYIINDKKNMLKTPAQFTLFG